LLQLLLQGSLLIQVPLTLLSHCLCSCCLLLLKLAAGLLQLPLQPAQNATQANVSKTAGESSK
jgi:hypothetical protein